MASQAGPAAAAGTYNGRITISAAGTTKPAVSFCVIGHGSRDRPALTGAIGTGVPPEGSAFYSLTLETDTSTLPDLLTPAIDVNAAAEVSGVPWDAADHLNFSPALSAA